AKRTAKRGRIFTRIASVRSRSKSAAGRKVGRRIGGGGSTRRFRDVGIQLVRRDDDGGPERTHALTRKGFVALRLRRLQNPGGLESALRCCVNDRTSPTDCIPVS